MRRHLTYHARGVFAIIAHPLSTLQFKVTYSPVCDDIHYLLVMHCDLACINSEWKTRKSYNFWGREREKLYAHTYLFPFSIFLVMAKDNIYLTRIYLSLCIFLNSCLIMLIFKRFYLFSRFVCFLVSWFMRGLS